MTKQQGSTHIGERMKAVTVYELMLMKERRDELETQRNELLDALDNVGPHNIPCASYLGSGCSCGRDNARRAIEKAAK